MEKKTTNGTDIMLLVDRSGSMGPRAKETIEGINTFIADQRKVSQKMKKDGIDVETRVTLAIFDDKYEQIYCALPIDDVPTLTDEVYFVRGGTALWDAIARTIASTKERLAPIDRDARPEVLFVIITDGQENQSTEIRDAETVRSMVKDCETAGWKTLFLGADMDAIAAGESVGARGVAFSGAAQGTARAIRAASAYVGSSRMAAHGYATASLANAVYGSSHVDQSTSLGAVGAFLASVDDDSSSPSGAVGALANAAAPHAITPPVQPKKRPPSARPRGKKI